MGKSTLDIQITKEGDITVISPDGPLDSATLPQFRAEMEPLSKKQRVKILLDCNELTYMNSKALGSLSSYRRRIYAKGGRLALCGLNSKLVRTMDLLGLGKILKIYQVREEAVASLS